MWHYIVNDIQYGPLNEDELERLLLRREIAPEALVWTEGMDEWQPARETILYSRIFGTHLPPPLPTIVPPPMPPHALNSGPRIVASMRGVNDLLEVYEDKVAITPQGARGFLSKGIKGTKFIPFYSITATQFKKCGLTAGYLQFTISGGAESKGGVFSAASDENSFMFVGGEKGNNEAIRIKNFIEGQITKARTHQPVQASSRSLADELSTLADLRSRGLLTDEEFIAAKAKLIKV